MEGGVKTLLLTGSIKKKLSARGRGVSGSEDFITDRKHTKKLSAGGRGVSGSEDFITDRKHTKNN